MKTLALTTTLLFLSIGTHAKQSFDQWKKSYAKRASKHGISKSFTLKTLSGITPDMSVVKKDRNQVTSSKNLDYQKFIKRWLRNSPSRLDESRKALSDNLALLEKVEAKYGVDKEVIVSLWGTETLFGKITGDYDLLTSLATLSWDGRRRKFFETQLNAALRLIKQGHVKRKDLKGSWAGATGQCQFMPSNIPVYGQDFDGDGKIDIWNNKADLFASIAYYMKRVGWKKGKSIGSLSYNIKRSKISLNKYRSKSEWNRLGFRNLDGTKLNDIKWKKRKAAKITMKNSPIVLRGSNYKPLMNWNSSSLFAAFNILIIDELKK
jgi:membrane-bound lytic murein transglycosylase B